MCVAQVDCREPWKSMPEMVSPARRGRGTMVRCCTGLLTGYQAAGETEAADLARMPRLAAGGARPVVEVASAAFHRLGAGSCTRRAAGCCCAGTSSIRLGSRLAGTAIRGERPAADRAARGGGGDRPLRPCPVAGRAVAARGRLLCAPVRDRARARARGPAVLPRHREPGRHRAGGRALAAALAVARRGEGPGRRQQPASHPRPGRCGPGSRLKRPVAGGAGPPARSLSRGWPRQRTVSRRSHTEALAGGRSRGGYAQVVPTADGACAPISLLTMPAVSPPRASPRAMALPRRADDAASTASLRARRVAVAPSGSQARAFSVRGTTSAPPGRSTRTASSTATRRSGIRCSPCTARTEPNVPAANGSLVASACASGTGCRRWRSRLPP